MVVAGQPFAELADGYVQGITSAYNAAATTCEKSGAWFEAVQLIATMAVDRAVKSIIVYKAATGVCEKRGAWPWAVEL